jgi:hypothetical protein
VPHQTGAQSVAKAMPELSIAKTFELRTGLLCSEAPPIASLHGVAYARRDGA